METHKLFPGKYFISSILEMLEYKSEMTGQTKRRYLMRAAMAGVIVGLLYIGNYTIQAGMEGLEFGMDEGLLPIGKLLGSTFFGFALVFIYFSKSELLTSNMMITTIGHYFHGITYRGTARVLSPVLPGQLPRRTVHRRPRVVLDDHQRADDGTDGSLRRGQVGVRHRRSDRLDGSVRPCDLLQLLHQPGDADGLQRRRQGRHREGVGHDRLGVRLRLPRLRALGGEHGALHDRGRRPRDRDPAGDRQHRHLPCRATGSGGGVLIGLYYAYLNDEARYLRQHPELADPQGQP